MIFSLITTITAILILLFIHKYYLKPKQKIKAYKRSFEQKGYKVYQFSTKMFTYPIIQTIYRDSEKGDAFYSYKNIFFDYDVIIGNQLQKPSISLLNPQLRKEFAKSQRNQYYQKLVSFSSQQARFAGYGLIFSQGQSWKRKRRIMGSLLTHQLIKTNISAIEQICIKTLEHIQQKSQVKIKQIDNQFQFELEDMAGICFSKIIISLFLGLKTLQTNINGIPIGKFILQLANQANMQAKGLLPLIFGVKFLDWGLTNQHRKINQKINSFNKWVDDFITNQINQHKTKKNLNLQSQKQDKDILSMHLKNNVKQGSKTEDNYCKQELISELKNFTIAGTDTSVSFFKMMVYYISQNQHVEQQLRKQIEQLSSQQKLDFETLKKFKYVQGIQKQTTRMYGPTNFNFPRRVLKDHYIDRIPIQKQTIIQYHSVCTHYNPKFYDCPHEFRPQRWIKQNEDKNSALLVGFGLGPRNCIGQHLASIQSKIALIIFYSRYKQVKVSQSNIKFKWKFLYKPDSFKVRVKKTT